MILTPYLHSPRRKRLIHAANCDRAFNSWPVVSISFPLSQYIPNNPSSFHFFSIIPIVVPYITLIILLVSIFFSIIPIVVPNNSQITPVVSIFFSIIPTVVAYINLNPEPYMSLPAMNGPFKFFVQTPAHFLPDPNSPVATQGHGIMKNEQTLRVLLGIYWDLGFRV